MGWGQGQPASSSAGPSPPSGTGDPPPFRQSHGWMDGWMGPFETPEERSQSSRLGSGSPVQSHPVARIARPGLLPLDTALRSRNSGQAPAVSCSRRRALGRGRVTASSTAGQEERKRKARVGLTPIYLIHSIQPSIPASSSLFFFFFPTTFCPFVQSKSTGSHWLPLPFPLRCGRACWSRCMRSRAIFSR